MSDNNLLHDFIAAQHERDLRTTETLATIAQSQKDMCARLFGGENQKGMLPYMIEAAKEQSAKMDDRFKEVETRTTSLETWRTGSKRWIAGAVAVLALEGSALGLYLQHVAKLK